MPHPELKFELIQSASDPRVSDYTNLSERVGIKQFCRFIAEGELVVRHLIESPYKVRSVFLADYWLPRAQNVLIGLSPLVPVYSAPESVLNAVVGFKFHRGILACGETGTLPSVPQLLANATTLVILEELSNHDNMGSIFRTASALGGSGVAVLVSADSCHPMYRKSIRVSMGHVLRIPFTISDHLEQDLILVHAAGFTSIALTPDPAAVDLRTIYPAAVPKPALLLGAEGPGLSASLLSAANLNVRIPMSSHTDSLNVGVAMGIALHHLATRVAD